MNAGGNGSRQTSGVAAILFDAVGTLIRPDPPAVNVYRQVGQAHGVELSHDEVARRFQTAFRAVFNAESAAVTGHAREQSRWREVVTRVFRESPAAAGPIFDQLWEHFAQSTNWSLYPDVTEAWRGLQSRGYLLGVASNYDDRLVPVLAGLPPLDRCPHVFWSAQLGFAKPHCGFFDRIAQRLRLPPEKILLVGDDLENDYHGARNAGWRAVLLDRSGARHAPDVIATLAEVATL